jgi:hypothetical protein
MMNVSIYIYVYCILYIYVPCSKNKGNNAWLKYVYPLYYITHISHITN